MTSRSATIPVLVIAMAWAVAGLAQFGAAAAPIKAGSGAKDPNRMICVTEDTTGSRLSRQRTCRTAQQWAESRREVRNTVDKILSNRGWNQDSDQYLRGLTLGRSGN